MLDTTPLSAARRVWQMPWLLAFTFMAVVNVHAQEWGGSAGFGSDNIYRGRSLTIDRPAWLADIHCVLAADWIVGAGATAERTMWQSAAAQITLYINRRWLLKDDWATSVGIVHYESPWDVYRDNLRYDELNGAISYGAHWRASLAISPNSPGLLYGPNARSNAAAWAELSYHQALIDRLSADIGVGYADLQQTVFHSYSYGSAGLNYGVGDVAFYLTRVWTSRPTELNPQNPYPAISRTSARWTASVVWSF
ncbi:hypothetical protein ELE36_07820 [Pseudolysobacter antarcticus]|uniref:MipA/OmpV family protein n=1 Tax=Pseudolysobacter antarcticus TaxID=2511995 RepID=A0A411HIQ1_9GAMM|nr:hypothetical protein [Pseudolysobacter antarcticus]QBB70277.1 hypothetical protein ELE36_07820 [Pseudolysobacter antarcticus]